MPSYDVSPMDEKLKAGHPMVNKLANNWPKCVYTAIFVYTHIAFGMTITMYPPIMVDMKYILHTSIRYVSLYTTFLSAGYMLGTVFGYLYEYINRQLTAIVFLTLMTVGSALTPLSPDLWSLYACAFAIGMGAAVWNTMANVWLIEMWANHSSPLLQLLHCGFGAGTIISPLILKSHLVGETRYHGTVDNSTVSNYTMDGNYSQGLEKEFNERRLGLVIPFQINAAIQILSPIAMLIMFVFKRYEPPPSPLSSAPAVLDTNDNNVTKPVPPSGKLLDRSGVWPRRWSIALFCVWLSAYCVAENTLMGFGATYFQFCPLRLTAQEAAQLLSTAAIAFTAGRGLSVLTAIYFKPQQMIGYHFVLLMISVVALYAGQYNLNVLRVSTVMAGLVIFKI
ncbi:unnamed protein product [Medioppia subpectinata]|uniref:Major facilitator superfamily domain-containing protein 4A n=1 Tax=Medioppia subpectinata TaxID=1979941 RepID=A0A7R9PY34_9ACAR|nr:unnamed protein product [Medioppia subpectinata]CAG2105011.1 unnamed protein product [Medioppia subpectinata]